MFSSLRNFHPLRVAASAGLRSALPKVLVGAALLGGVALSSNPANAAFCTFGVAGTCQANTDYTIGDKVFNFTQLPTAGAGSIVGTVINPDLYTLAVEFDPDLSGPAVGSFGYTVSVALGSPSLINGISLNVDDQLPNTSAVVKTVDGIINVPRGSVVALVPTSSISVLDTYTVPAGNDLVSFSNAIRQTSVTVPGPLPLLGAGAAFGFSRKLRTRVKAAKSAAQA
jgi:hypothetical protein